MFRKIDIFDTTLRDGEQVPGAKLNEEQKIEVARQLAKMKVDVIEAGFPVSSPGDYEAVKRIAREINGPIITALARTVKEDIDILWDAIRHAERPRIHIVLGTSDVHVEKKLGMNRDQAFEMGLEALKYAKSLCEEVEYSTEDASRSDFDYLCRVIEAVIKAGATVVNIPDTVGYAIPEQFGETIKRIRERVPNIHKVILSVHCHNDLGMATANTLAAIKNGVTQVECTINGIGERAGNTSLEEVVMALKTRGDFFDAYSEVDTKQIYKSSRLVSHLMGIPVQPNKAIVGSNAFAHSSGIHQDGILKDRRTYEIIKPEDVGVMEHSIILTARSGRHALRHRLEQMGYQISEEIFEQIYKGFLNIADKKKEVAQEDLESLVEGEISKVPETFHFENVQTVGGNRALPLASVTLSKNGQSITEAASGNGPIDAAFACINRVTGQKVSLLSYDLNAVTKGADALGEATVKIQINGETVIGRASSTDVIEASTKAYVNAINKALASKH